MPHRNPAYDAWLQAESEASRADRRAFRLLAAGGSIEAEEALERSAIQHSEATRWFCEMMDEFARFPRSLHR